MSDERLARIEDRLDGIVSGLTELRSDVTELRSDVTELRSDVIELRSNITELRGDVKALQVGQATLEQGQAEIRAELTAKIESTRTEVLVQFESLRDDFRVVAEGHVALGERMDKGFAKARRETAALIAPIRLVVADHTRRLDAMSRASRRPKRGR